MKKRNPVARSLRSPHLQQRIIPNKKRAAKERLTGCDSVTNLAADSEEMSGEHESKLRRVRLLRPDR